MSISSLFKARPLAVAVSMASFAAFSSVAYAQEQEELINSEAVESAEVDEEQVTEEVIVTGSRIRRGNFDGATNVEVYTRDDMISSGFADMTDLIDALPQSTGATQGEQYTNSFTSAAESISFRGLGGSRTLVLLNGLRLPEYPLPYNGQSNFFNTRSLPSGAIERSEILNGGASAIYGSDAVAGVVNIITRREVDETTLKVNLGTTHEGGGDNYSIEAFTGFNFDNGSVTLGIDYGHQDPVYGKDRDWLDSYEDQPFDQPYPDRAILTFDNFTGLYVDPGEQACIDSKTDYPYSERPGRGFYCGFDGDGDQTLQSDYTYTNAYLDARYNVTDSIEAFATVIVNKTEVEQRGFRLFWGGDILDQNFNYHYLQRIFSPAETGEQESNFDETSVNVQFGLSGEMPMMGGNYYWDAAVSGGNYDSYNTAIRFKEELINEHFLGSTDLWGYGILSGSDVNSIYDFMDPSVSKNLMGDQWQDANSRSIQGTFNFSGPVPGLQLAGGDIMFNLNLEKAHNEYEILMDERTLDQTGNGWWGLTGTKGAGERDRSAVGLEVLFPVLDNLEFTLATRYDEYDDASNVGGRQTSEVSGRWDIIEDLVAIRSSWSESFRAPDMHYLFKDTSGFYTNAADYKSCYADGTPDDQCQGQQIFGTSGGNLNLREETGENFNFGLLLYPLDGLNISIDYVKIELNDVVTNSSIDTTLQDERDCFYNLKGRDSNSAFCQEVYSYVTRSDDPVSGTQDALDAVYSGPVNQSYLMMDAIDVSVSYALETSSAGLFLFDFDYTNTLHDREQERSEDEVVDYRNQSYNPRSNGTLRSTWMPDDKTSVTLTLLRTGSIMNYDYNEHIDPWLRANLYVNHRLTDNLDLSFTVVNVLDERPPEDDTWTSWPYFYRGQYNALGRQLSLSATYRF